MTENAKTIKASDYGIVPGASVGKALAGLFGALSETRGEKTLVFDGGVYYIDSEELEAETAFITNTVGDGEFSAGETPHRVKFAFALKNIRDLTVEGNGAEFLLRGKATNAAIRNCENITLKDIEFDVEAPDMQELTAVKKGAFYVDFRPDAESRFKTENGRLVFYGKDYSADVIKAYRYSGYLACIRKETPETVKRGSHLFRFALKAKALGNGCVRVYYINTSKIREGDRYYIFKDRRDNVGIFIDSSKNVIFERLSQRFNYSLGIVAQNCENLTFHALDLSPSPKSGRKIASTADFLHICSCRGKVSVTDSNFDGACDDCMNVHGVHLKIKKIDGNTVTAEFMHPQTHGFNTLRDGDTVVFTDPSTLLEKGRAKVVSSRLTDEHRLEIITDSVSGAREGFCVENISACPRVEFKNNTATRIITRGLLMTTRGKVEIEGNRFVSTSMSGVLLSDDASSWYESGPCADVTIKDNIFDYCGENGVLIKPENSVHAGAVHKNIKIIGNEFKKCAKTCVWIKSSENIEIKGNAFGNENRLYTENCKNIEKDF